jgi:hypothetical protein
MEFHATKHRAADPTLSNLKFRPRLKALVTYQLVRTFLLAGPCGPPGSLLLGGGQVNPDQIGRVCQFRPGGSGLNPDPVGRTWYN